MDLKAYVAPLLKWWWLLVVATALATTSAFLATRDLPAVYQAHTTLLIGRSIYDPNPTSTEFALSQQLAGIYITIAKQDRVQNAALAALGLKQLPKYDVKSVANGQFIEISVTDTSSERAQAVANELANQLIQQTPGNPQQGQELQAFVAQQLSDLQATITETQDDIAAKQKELANKTSARDIADTSAEIAALQTKLTSLQTSFANLLSTSQQGAINILTVVEQAALPTKPIGPKKLQIILLAAASGWVLAAGAAYLLEFLDDTVRTPEDVARVLKLPIIGHIGEMKRKKEGGVFVADQPHSPAAEAFRSLRTNLEFAAVDKPLKTILVTSSGEGEGKTTVASNLAVIMAHGGKKVVLLDADLRQPNVHNSLGMPNRDGLSDIFRSSVNVLDALRPWKDERVSVIVSGSLPPNPTELLGSKKMDHILASLEEVADVIIIDGPPFLLADAWVLSAKADGVLLVIRPGYTRKDAARAMMEQTHRVGARVVGVTLNRIMRQNAGYYGGYAYSAASFSTHGKRSDENEKPGVKGGVKPLAALFRRLQRAPKPKGISASELEAPAPDAELAATERTRDSLKLLLAISRELAAHADPPDLLQRILQLSLEGVGASSGSIMMLNGQGEVIQGALAYAGKVHPATAQQLAETLEGGLAGWVAEHRQAALITSTRDDPRWLRRSWDESNGASRSAISAPLTAGDQVYGVLTLVHPRTGAFTGDDLALLTTIALSISVQGAHALMLPQTSGN